MRRLPLYLAMLLSIAATQVSAQPSKTNGITADTINTRDNWYWLSAGGGVNLSYLGVLTNFSASIAWGTNYLSMRYAEAYSANTLGGYSPKDISALFGWIHRKDFFYTSLGFGMGYARAGTWQRIGTMPIGGSINEGVAFAAEASIAAKVPIFGIGLTALLHASTITSFYFGIVLSIFAGWLP